MKGREDIEKELIRLKTTADVLKDMKKSVPLKIKYKIEALEWVLKGMGAEAKSEKRPAEQKTPAPVQSAPKPPEKQATNESRILEIISDLEKHNDVASLKGVVIAADDFGMDTTTAINTIKKLMIEQKIQEKNGILSLV